MNCVEKPIHIVLAGGDQRMVCLAALLASDGHCVTTLALEHESPDGLSPEVSQAVKSADCLILPIPPWDSDGGLTAPLSGRHIPVEALLAALPTGRAVCAGGPAGALAPLVEERGLIWINYLEQEELAIANAVPTAEGVLKIALEELPRTLHGCSCLVIGCGRCGYALAERLSALHGRVTVSARSQSDWARIQAAGWTPAKTEALTDLLPEMELIVNTVPAPVLGRAELSAVRRKALILDIASRPGGVDWAAAEERKLKAIHALGLPGKIAPLTAAENLRDAIYHGMEEHMT